MSGLAWHDPIENMVTINVSYRPLADVWEAIVHTRQTGIISVTGPSRTEVVKKVLETLDRTGRQDQHESDHTAPSQGVAQ